MKNTLVRRCLLSALSCAALGTAQTSQAAIVAGTDNGDGSWTVAGSSISMGEDFGGNFITLSEWEIIGSSTSGNIVRRNSDTDDTGSPLSVSRLHYNTQFMGLQGGTVPGPENWLLLAFGEGSTDWDTAVQFDATSHTILQVWYDNNPTGGDVLQGALTFSDITASSVPEPSSALLLGLGTCGFLIRRRRRLAPNFRFHDTNNF